MYISSSAKINIDSYLEKLIGEFYTAFHSENNYYKYKR